MSDFQFFSAKPELSQMDRYKIRKLSGLSDDEVWHRTTQNEVLFGLVTNGLILSENYWMG